MRFRLCRERLNQGGYTSYGHYFGVGAPLYGYCSDDVKYEGMIRASSRADAKRIVRERHPEARPTFYN